MNIYTKRVDGALVLSLTGELDHHAAKTTIPKIAEYIDIELPTKLILDFDSVQFMDSSGIALVIGTYKRITACGGVFSVINVSRQAYKVFDAAGLCRVIDISLRKPQTVNK